MWLRGERAYHLNVSAGVSRMHKSRAGRVAASKPSLREAEAGHPLRRELAKLAGIGKFWVQ